MQQRALQMLVFEVGGQRYGLPAADVVELLRAVSIVPLPGAPASIEGIINLRGKVVPVLDVRWRFGLPPRPLEHTDHFIVVRTDGRVTALRVDRALDLLQLDPADIDDARDVVPGVEHIARIARLADDLVLIHDLRTFLSREALAVLDKAAAQQPGGRP